MDLIKEIIVGISSAMPFVFLIVILIVDILLLIFFFEAKHENEEKLKTLLMGGYWRESPVAGEHPVIIASLLSGFTSENDRDGSLWAAEILRLVDTDVIRMEKVGDDTILFAGDKEPQTYLDNIALDVIANDFALATGDGRYLSVKALSKFAKRQPFAYRACINRWYEYLKTAAQAKGYVPSPNRPNDVSKMSASGEQTWILVIMFVLLVLYSICVGNFAHDSAVLIIPAFIAYLIAFFIVYVNSPEQMTKVTEKGWEASVKAWGLKRWLSDFTTLEESPPKDVILWNELIVYATAFGIADRVLKELKTNVSEIYKDKRLKRAQEFCYSRYNESPMARISAAHTYMSKAAARRRSAHR